MLLSKGLIWIGAVCSLELSDLSGCLSLALNSNKLFLPLLDSLHILTVNTLTSFDHGTSRVLFKVSLASPFEKGADLFGLLCLLASP
jgi:hypothetical protein